MDVEVCGGHAMGLYIRQCVVTRCASMHSIHPAGVCVVMRCARHSSFTSYTGAEKRAHLMALPLYNNRYTHLRERRRVEQEVKGVHLLHPPSRLLPLRLALCRLMSCVDMDVGWRREKHTQLLSLPR